MLFSYRFQLITFLSEVNGGIMKSLISSFTVVASVLLLGNVSAKSGEYGWFVIYLKKKKNCKTF